MLSNHKREMQAKDEANEAELARAAATQQELQEALNIKAAELKRVRFLSRNMLDQRSEVEQFLLESIACVKREIAATRNQYKQAARAQYQEGVRAAHAGGQAPPQVRDLSVKGFEAEFRRAEEAQADLSKVGMRCGRRSTSCCCFPVPQSPFPFSARPHLARPLPPSASLRPD